MSASVFMSRRTAVVSLAALGACAAQEPSSPAPQIDRSTFAFEVPGEPGRTSSGRGIIFGDRIIFRTPESAGWHQSTIDARQEDGTTRRFRAGDTRVTVEPGGCRGNAARPDRVTTSYPGRLYRGCGGPRAVPTAIGGTTWTVRELDGQRAPDGTSPAATLTFSEQGTISGTNACNEVGGGIRWRDGRFEKPENEYDLPLSTLIRCPEPSSSEFGAKFWSRMMQARTWTRDGATLWITFADGSRAGLALIL